VEEGEDKRGGHRVEEKKAVKKGLLENEESRGEGWETKKQNFKIEKGEIERVLYAKGRFLLLLHIEP